MKFKEEEYDDKGKYAESFLIKLHGHVDSSATHFLENTEEISEFDLQLTFNFKSHTWEHPINHIPIEFGLRSAKIILTLENVTMPMENWQLAYVFNRIFSVTITEKIETVREGGVTAGYSTLKGGNVELKVGTKGLKADQKSYEYIHEAVDMSGLESEPIIKFQAKEGNILWGLGSKFTVGKVKIKNKDQTWSITAKLIVEKEDIEIITYGKKEFNKNIEEISWLDRIQGKKWVFEAITTEIKNKDFISYAKLSPLNT